jgi:hypothetical protein
MIDVAQLPPLFAGWIGEWLTQPLPVESHATCDRCAMCAPVGTHDAAGGYFFEPSIKCCTYLPVIPNFLAGQILSDEGADLAHGRATMNQRIAAGVAVTPFGLGIPPRYQLLYRNATDFFGRASGLQCPHYVEDGGRCGIWRHRDATCATWFCKHERGATGQTFWLAMRDLLTAVEHDLARWCVLTLVEDERVLAALAGADPLADRLDADAVDGRPNPETYRSWWGDWTGREREFFVQAGRLVEGLHWNHVLEICGPDVRIRSAAVEVAHRRLLDPGFPHVLRLGRHEIVRRAADGSTLLRTYSDFDPLIVPQPLLDVLPFFDGRPTADVCQAMADERGLVLTSTQLRDLIDFRILLP